MKVLVEIAFVIIVTMILIVSACIAPVRRGLSPTMYCTNGFREIVHRGQIIGCQRGWRS